MPRNNHKWGLIQFTFASDYRGDLVAIEFRNQLPFQPERFFATYNVPAIAVRGEHAHIECDQVLLPLAGKTRVVLSDGFQQHEFLLEDPTVGLYVPKLTWGTQQSLTASSILGVFASHAYEESDYIRNYANFLEKVAT